MVACGGADDEAGDDTLAPTATDASDTTVVTPDEPVDPEPDNASEGRGTATVTFEEDGSTLEFALDECYTSNTNPGNFVNVPPEGAFASHGVLDDGWELQLSMFPGASGDMLNLSFLTDGDQIDYGLQEDFTYEVDGGNFTASATSDIYQTFDEEEAIPLSFDVSCNG